MYRFKPELRIPGPVPVPTEVLGRMSQPMINHRGKIFKDVFPRSWLVCSPSLGQKTPSLW